MRRQKIQVLVVDDDLQFLRLLTCYLRLEGYDAEAATDAQQAIEQVTAQRPDLVLLNGEMRQGDGFTICRRIKECSHAPVICMTTLQTDERSGLIALGADDYLCKPFDVDELQGHMWRVLRHGRRSEPQPAQADTRRKDAHVEICGDLVVDIARSRVSRAGHEISLTPRERLLLACLARHVGRVVSQELLLQLVWGSEYADENHVLQVTMHRLRHKLEPDPAQPRFLLTKSSRGCVVGYLLTSPSTVCP